MPVQRRNKVYHSPPDDERMGYEVKILGGSFEAKVKRCWINNEKEATECFTNVIMWMKNGTVRESRIKHSNFEKMTEWRKRGDNVDSFTEAMFHQFPMIANEAERFIKHVVEKGARTHEDFSDLNVFLWTMAQREIERVEAKKVKFDRVKARKAKMASQMQVWTSNVNELRPKVYKILK